jgi:protein kinase C substrate 80K-H
VRVDSLSTNVNLAVFWPGVADMIEARKKYNDLSSSLSAVQSDLRNTKDALGKLDTDFGPQGEWKKLENTCIDREQGE